MIKFDLYNSEIKREHLLNSGLCKSNFSENFENIDRELNQIYGAEFTDYINRI